METKYDLLIIGAGSAGIPCAIRAAERGRRVLVVDKQEEPGGTLHRTAGHLSAGGTRLQARRGIMDSPDDHYADVMRISRGTANPEIAGLATRLAPQTLDWLEDLGYVAHERAPLIIHGHEPYSKPRTVFGANDYAGGPITKPGKAVLKTLLPHWRRCLESGLVQFLPSTTLTGFALDGNRITGVDVLREGWPTRLSADRYVLASGGYAANPDLFAEWVERPRRLISTASPSSTGDGLRLVRDIGGIIDGGKHHLSTLGGVELEPGSGRAEFWEAWARVSNSVDRAPREIYVNAEGRRFMNELDLTVDQRERIVLQQPGSRFWVLFDEDALNAGPCIVVQWDADRLRAEAGKGLCVWQGETPEQLAERAGLPPEVLRQTFDRWNQIIDAGADADFGRSTVAWPLRRPPFYALLTHAYSLISFAGVQVDGQLRVKRQSGGVFENLYAAGEMLGAAATSGNSFCGGMLLTPAISFGKWLGETL